MDKFTKAYLNLITESSDDDIGLEDFPFPKYRYSHVEVGDELVYIWSGNHGESGRWGIPYWYVYSEKVTVTEVDDKNFKLDNGIVVLKNKSSEITTKEYYDTYLDASGTDTYDFHTPLPTKTVKKKQSDGKGVYPASFLLKYYVNKKKGYSLIGGGPTYKGLNFDQLKEMALKEKNVQKQLTKQVGVKTEATQKDIDRMNDILQLDNLEFYVNLFGNFVDSNIFDYAITHNNLGLDKPSEEHSGYQYNKYLQKGHEIRQQIRKCNVSKIYARVKCKQFKCDNYGICRYAPADVRKSIEKMAKLIKDYDKCMRRIDAVNKIFDKVLQDNILLNSKDPNFYNEAMKLVVTSDTYQNILKFKDICAQTFPKFTNKFFKENPIGFVIDTIQIQPYKDEIIKIFEKRAEELKQDRERLQ